MVAGLGRAGHAAIAALLRGGAEPHTVRAWDSAQGATQERAQRELGHSGVQVTLGGDGRAPLAGDPVPRTIVKSPGIPPGAPLLSRARELGMDVLDEAELGWRMDSRPTLGVTGTNGKSTCASLAVAMLRRAGASPVLAGNSEFGTPYSAAAGEEGDIVVAELSSFQLAAAPRLLPDAALFTNLTREHWAHHGGQAGYAAAKRRAFVRGKAAVSRAAVNTDDPFGRALESEITERGGRVVSYGRAEDAAYRIERDAWWDLDASEFRVSTPSGTRTLRTALPGAHNALNVAAALALGDALGLELDDVAAAVEGFAGLPGRLERVGGPEPFDVFVDYAHNPDGLEQVLSAARSVTARRPTGRLVAVASAIAGYEDAEVQEMGRVLGRLADRLTVTACRRTPDTAPGLEQLRLGAREVGARPSVIPDRRPAIENALGEARPGDVVLVLGRGARPGLMLHSDGEVRLTDDRDLTRDAIVACTS